MFLLLLFFICLLFKFILCETANALDTSVHVT